MDKYKDIINLVHYQSKTRRHMTLEERSCQFAPFAALDGYGDAVTETGRITDEKIELSDYEKEIIDNRLNLIEEHINEDINVEITYFVKDKKKDGGEYIVVHGIIKKIDKVFNIITLKDNKKIDINDIISIDSEYFNKI